MLYDFKLPDEGNLYFCSSLNDAVKGALWIQESVPERLEVKHKVLSEIQKYCTKTAVIRSSTSGFMASQLQENSFFPDQIMVCKE
jgi:carnitine 3-dehydrogenase